MNQQYLPLPFLFPLTYAPLDSHWHEMGSRGSAKKKVEGLQHPAEAAVPRPILARISGHRYVNEGLAGHCHFQKCLTYPSIFEKLKYSSFQKLE